MMSSRHKTVQELSENDHLHAVLSDYIVPEEERRNLKDKLNYSTTGAALELPLIDMNEVAETQRDVEGDHTGLVQQIRTVCEEWGFFQVKNHGVSLSLMEQMQQAVHEFLELPLEEKNKMRFTSPDSQVDLAGGYTSNYAMSEGGISNWSDRLSLRMFPTSIRKYDLWPKNPPCFRQVAELYCKEQKKLAKKLLELVSESLGLEPSYIKEYVGEDCVQTFVANYYPSCPQPELAMGLVKHSDPSAITVLLQDTNSGLQVLNDGEWITVKPIEGAFVVNLGDQIEVIMWQLINGKYKSIEHRAFVSSQPRMTMVTFTSSPEERIVGPIPELLAAEELPKYKQCSFGEYMKSYSDTYTGSWHKRTSGKNRMHTFMAQPQ